MKFLKIMVCAICIFTAQTFYGQSVQVGHRLSGVPVLDVTTSTFSPAISSHLSSNGFTFVSINNLILDDVVADPTYYMNLTMEIEFTDVSGIEYTGNYYFTLLYDAVLNKYYLDNTGGTLEIPNGGKVTCSAENCKGCKPYKGEKGQPNGCTDCTAKVDPNAQNGPTCNHGSSGGNGAAWLGAIASALGVLLGLL